MNNELLAITTAYLLDVVIGDPQWNWHPVRLIGRFIATLEGRLNTGDVNKKFSGVTLVILVVSVTVFSVWGILKLAMEINPALYFALSVMLIYFALSIKSLAVEAGKVYKSLKNNNIQGARDDLSMIVGRDTYKLEEPEIIRATVETVAESTMDGVVAPLFYAFLGGPVFVWAYKAINTLDSMVGYKSERFVEFGKASAKLDGLVNLIPAKITCIFISVSSWFYGKNCLNSFKWGLRFFLKGQENNSIATEAAMAGALNIQLGGVNLYDSVPVTKPFIGDGVRPLEIIQIQESINIVYLCSFLLLLTGLLLLVGPAS